VDVEGGGVPTGSFAEQVYRAVRRIPAGRVLSYGEVAARLGRPRAARGVGRALAALPQGSDVPWWRVVGHGGAISLRHRGALLQRMLLEAEGVRVGPGGKVERRKPDPEP
jgi:methylated-DNA-protein-cysteine methyltransferase related protein